MKNILATMALGLLTATTATAQTQHGYVKTKGRLSSNGTVVAGTRLPGTAVQVKGRTTVLSQSNGSFSFPIPSQNFYLQSVQKQGYVLTDPDVLSRQYAYSKNPLVLVLETPEQQANDQLDAKRKIRHTLAQQLQEKENVIEQLKKQQKLSEEDYRKHLQDIYSQQESNEQLISEMAERYARIDFDEVDDFNRRISDCILNGRLTEADSLLNTKGDINSRAATLRQHQEANAKTEQELKKRQKKLEKSKAMTQRELEDLAQDCYSKFQIHKMLYENDSAAYYIEMRANLDTTKVEWQLDAGKYYTYTLSKLSKAMSLYRRALQAASNQYGQESGVVANIWGDISENCRYQDKYKEAIEYGQKSLDLNRNIYGEHHLDVAQSHGTLALAYSASGELKTGMTHIRKAIDIKKEILGEDHISLAEDYNNIANIFANLSQKEEAFKYAKKSLDLNLNYYGEQSGEIISNYLELGALYINAARFEEGMDYCFKAIELLKQQKSEHHLQYITACNMVSHGYSFQGEFEKGLEYAQISLNIAKEMLGEKHMLVALSLQDVGYAYSYLGDNEKSLQYNLQALQIIESLGSHANNLAQCYNNVGYLSYLAGKYQDALDFHKKALKMRIETIGERSIDAAQSYDNMGMAQFAMEDYDNSLKSHLQALSIRKEVQGEKHPELAWSYLGIGDVKYARKDYAEALDNYQKAYEVRKEGIGEKHPDTVLCLTKMGQTYRSMKDRKQAVDCYQKAASLYKEMFGESNPSTQAAEQTLSDILNEKKGK